MLKHIQQVSAARSVADTSFEDIKVHGDSSHKLGPRARGIKRNVSESSKDTSEKLSNELN